MRMVSTSAITAKADVGAHVQVRVGPTGHIRRLSTIDPPEKLKLFLDDDDWVMPVTVGDKPHSYHWMPYRVGQAPAEELAKKSEE
jgi:hypothetical protein